MAGAVIVVEAAFPQGHARERVELDAGRAFRKARAGEGNVSLEHAREAVLHLGRRRADDNGTCWLPVVPSRYWPPESMR